MVTKTDVSAALSDVWFQAPLDLDSLAVTHATISDGSCVAGKIDLGI